MSNKTTLFTSVLSVFCCIALLSSCASTSVSTGGKGTVAGIEVNGPPLTHFGNALVTPVGSRDVVFCQLLSETDMRIERYDSLMRGLWSTPFRLSAKEAPLGYIDPTAPAPDKDATVRLVSQLDPQEQGITIYPMKNRIALLTTIVGEDDSLCLMGRYFDLATGKHLETKMIHSSIFSESLPIGMHDYSMSYSSDSSRLLFFLPRHGDSVNQMNLETVILSRDADQPVVRTLMLPVRTDPRDFVNAVIDNAGNIYVAKKFRENDTTFTVTRFEAPSMTRGKELHAMIRRPDPSARIHWISIHPSEDGSAVGIIADGTEDENEMVGMMGFRFDFAAGNVIPGNYLMIDEKLLEATIDDDELEEPMPLTILASPKHGRYVVVLEERYMANTAKSTVSVTGDVLAIGFDEKMSAKWTVGIVKEQKMGGLSYSFISCASRISPNGTMQITYLNDGHLSMHEYAIADGRPAPDAPNGRHLLEVGGGLFPYLPSFTWLGDDALLFHAHAGLLSSDINVYRVATRR